MLRDPKSGDIPGLAASMKKHQLVPVMVTKNGAGYDLVFGHRRWLAAKNNKGMLLAQVVEMTATERLVAAITENMAREDMTDLEKAEGLGKLKDETKWTAQRIASLVGLSLGTVKTLLALYGSPPSVKQAVKTSETQAKKVGAQPITIRHVAATAQIENKTDRAALLRSAAKRELTSDELRRRAPLLARATSARARNQIINAESGAHLISDEYIETATHSASIRKQPKSSPKVKAVLDEIRDVQGMVLGWGRAVKTAAFGKEACQFTEHQLGILINSLNSLRASVVREKGRKST